MSAIVYAYGSLCMYVCVCGRTSDSFVQVLEGNSCFRALQPFNISTAMLKIDRKYGLYHILALFNLNLVIVGVEN
jgi:hypothetical protein